MEPTYFRWGSYGNEVVECGMDKATHVYLTRADFDALVAQRDGTTARDDAVEDAASVERAASKWIASEVDAYPGTTMDDRIASWMRGGVHPDDVSRFLVDAYVAGHRAALRREKESRSDDSRPASGQGCA